MGLNYFLIHEKQPELEKPRQITLFKIVLLKFSNHHFPHIPAFVCLSVRHMKAQDSLEYDSLERVQKNELQNSPKETYNDYESS